MLAASWLPGRPEVWTHIVGQIAASNSHGWTVAPMGRGTCPCDWLWLWYHMRPDDGTMVCDRWVVGVCLAWLVLVQHGWLWVLAFQQALPLRSRTYEKQSVICSICVGWCFGSCPASLTDIALSGHTSGIPSSTSSSPLTSPLVPWGSF